ncbi:hypothetical protein ACFWVE_33020, partial [Streptomyces sp. NPDC058632]
MRDGEARTGDIPTGEGRTPVERSGVMLVPYTLAVGMSSFPSSIGSSGGAKPVLPAAVKNGTVSGARAGRDASTLTGPPGVTGPKGVRWSPPAGERLRSAVRDVEYVRH